MIRFLLDGAEYTAPMNYREMKFVHKRDEAIRGLMYGFNSSLQFHGDAYDYLRAEYDAENCGWIEVDIEEKSQLSSTWNTMAEARIYKNEIQWDLFKRIATCKLTDRSFNSMIASNKNVKGYCDVPKSKSGEDITGFEATAITVKLFDATSGLYSYTGKAYKVFDVLKWSVAFMTAGNVEFESDTFDVGGVYEWFCIGSGIGLRTNVGNPAPYISFQDLFGDLAKLFNLSFYIREVGGIWKIKIEVEDDTFSSTSSTSIDGLYNVQESLAEEKFYANIKCGSATVQKAEGGTYLYPDIRLMSHKQEEYNTQIECNLDTTLDLSCKNLITDTNVFDHITRVDPTDEKYDDKNFILHYYDDAGTFKAVQSTLVDSAGTIFVYYANDMLMNERVGNRWSRYIPVGLSSYYATGDYTCVATDSGVVQTGYLGNSYSPGQVMYDTDVYDPSNVFNTTTAFYEAPADGIYTFKVAMSVEFTVDWPYASYLGIVPIALQVVFKRWDNTVMTVLHEECINKIFLYDPPFLVSEGIPNGTNVKLGEMWVTMYLTAGDRVGAYVENFSGPANYGSGTGFGYGIAVHDALIPDPTLTYNLQDASFACTWFATGGGNIEGSATEYLRVHLHEFEKCIEKSKYDTIIGLPLAAIALDLPDGAVPAYVEQIEYNPVNKDCKFKLLSSTSVPL